MARGELMSFDLVVATVDRVRELEGLLDSLEAQTHRRVRLLLIDQNEDDRLVEILQEHPSLTICRLRSKRGLSRSRNRALDLLDAELVGFPDDDCSFPPNLLERVARRFATEPALDGLTGATRDDRGQTALSWATGPTVLERDNFWNRAASATIFLRKSLIERVGRFDEELGLGSDGPWSSGEETDYLIRALDSGARIEYDPSLVVIHPEQVFTPSALRSVGARDGASLGYILRKHDYPKRVVGRMLLRPVGGALLALARRDSARMGFHLATLRGRVLGYRS
jgi:GT2 family glycosyltransferase